MERVGGVFDGRDRPHRRRRRSRRARGERNGTRVRVCATLMFAPAGIGAVIAGSHALLLRCLATGHARGVVGTLALLRGHATQGVKDGVVGEGARTRFADACRRTVPDNYFQKTKCITLQYFLFENKVLRTCILDSPAGSPRNWCTA